MLIFVHNLSPFTDCPFVLLSGDYHSYQKTSTMTENTATLIGIDARRKILSGVTKVWSAVRLSLGPEGRNALLPRTFNRGPRITNDGITIAELAKMLPDPHERLAAEAFVEGSKKTNEIVGDGTTTTAEIAGFLINKIFKDLNALAVPTASIDGKKASPVKGVRALRQEMKDAKDLVIAEIKAAAKPIKTLADLEKIAVVSIGQADEEISKIIAKMVWDIGRDEAGNFVDNYIDVTEGYKQQIETEVIKGMRFPSKVASRAFVNVPERFEMVAADVRVFVTNYKLDNQWEVVEMLNTCKANKVALFAPEFSQGVIQSLIATTKAGMFCYPIKCPSLRTEQLEDLAAYTGATVIDKETGRKINNTTESDLGFASKITVKDTENREDAVLFGGRGESKRLGKGNVITERIEKLRGQLKEARDNMVKMTLEKRIANLSSAVGVIRVGATTSNEGLYLKLKIEDGVYACKAALQEGYVKGGGLCLKEIADKLPADNILVEALQSPFRTIQKNAGGELSIGKEIIDPAKVVRLEVEHGVSVASMIITSDICIPDAKELSPGEGYAEIAKAIRQYSFYWAKDKGMLKESEDMLENDRNREFERVLEGDRG